MVNYFKRRARARDAFCKCARALRQEAARLMKIMSETFHIDLETLDGLFELKFKKSNKQRGQLNDEWNYFLHGAECRFDNLRTGQIVEVIITTFPEFGTLDGFFSMNTCPLRTNYSHQAIR